MNIKDYYGSPIVPGAKVAYNFSGSVILGHVIAVKKVKRYGRAVNQWTKEPYVEIEVKPMLMAPHTSPAVSRVSSPNNLVVIN